MLSCARVCVCVRCLSCCCCCLRERLCCGSTSTTRARARATDERNKHGASTAAAAAGSAAVRSASIGVERLFESAQLTSKHPAASSYAPRSTNRSKSKKHTHSPIYRELTVRVVVVVVSCRCRCRRRRRLSRCCQPARLSSSPPHRNPCVVYSVPHRVRGGCSCSSCFFLSSLLVFLCFSVRCDLCYFWSVQFFYTLLLPLRRPPPPPPQPAIIPASPSCLVITILISERDIGTRAHSRICTHLAIGDDRMSVCSRV